MKKSRGIAFYDSRVRINEGSNSVDLTINNTIKTRTNGDNYVYTDVTFSKMGKLNWPLRPWVSHHLLT